MALTPAGGIKALRKLQLGVESTPGTAVASTVIWRGMGMLTDNQEVKHVDEEVGIALPTTRAYIPKLAAGIKFDPVEVTPQYILYILEGGVAAESATQDGTGSGYIYAYAFPGTSLGTLNTYTIEGGNNQKAYEVEYCFVERFKISGNQGEGLMMEADWIGRQKTDTTFTGSQTTNALVPGDHLPFGAGAFYLDAVGGTIGGTAVTGQLLSFELDVQTGWMPVWTEQYKYFDYVQWVRNNFSATLKLVYKHHTVADAQEDLFDAATPRLVRLQFDGHAVSDNTGATYNNVMLQINAAGIYTEFVPNDVDGNDVREATMQIGHDLTATQGLDFVVVNELSALS